MERVLRGLSVVCCMAPFAHLTSWINHTLSQEKEEDVTEGSAEEFAHCFIKRFNGITLEVKKKKIATLQVKVASH